ncbi:MAG: adenylate/guanylate cyclase domain-containing protein [Desulfococcaceae bacterium]|nr:adenylate/guanylate cyclase domain-containing protein [Desulfococcaceae bacterium]
MRKKTYVTDHMMFIGLGLAGFYWLCESFLSIFLQQKTDIAALLFGNRLDEIWGRIVVLCLFVIFASHAQYTIDKRKKAENALRESEERYRTLIENIPIGICRMEAFCDGRYLMVNPSFLKIFSYESEDDLKYSLMNSIWQNKEECRIFADKILQKGSYSLSEVLLIKKNGIPVWTSVSARLVYPEGPDKAPCFDCTFEDIDERKKSAEKIQQEAETRRRFQKMLSPDLADLVVSGELKVEKGGRNRVATVLFADIRGFTTMSESTPASEILRMLNEYFEFVVDIIFRYEGTVDKYIGDAIMVNWGAPVRHEDDPVRAVRAALEMRAGLKVFNRKREMRGQQPIQVGIGINTGKLVAGYIGSTHTMSYSVIGDTVNTASRLCSAAAADQVLISESTYEHVKDIFSVTRLRPIMAKGKLYPVQIFSVVGEPATSLI